MNKLHLKTIEGDEAFYYRNVDCDFHGTVLNQVDDFELTGISDFLEEIIQVVEKELNISKIEEDRFRYTGLDINVVSENAKSLQNITEIRKVEVRNESLNKEEMKLYRKITRKNCMAG